MDCVWGYLLRNKTVVFLRCGFIPPGWRCKLDKAPKYRNCSFCVHKRTPACIQISVVHIQPHIVRCARDAGKDLRLSCNYYHGAFIKPFNYTDHRWFLLSSSLAATIIYQRVKFHLERWTCHFHSYSDFIFCLKIVLRFLTLRELWHTDNWRHWFFRLILIHRDRACETKIRLTWILIDSIYSTKKPTLAFICVMKTNTIIINGLD